MVAACRSVDAEEVARLSRFARRPFSMCVAALPCSIACMQLPDSLQALVDHTQVTQTVLS